MPATFYVLFSRAANKFYIGHTSEPIEERLRKHLSGHEGFTAKYKDWKIMYMEDFPSKSLAFKREREVKNWKSRSRIELLNERATRSEHPA